MKRIVYLIIMMMTVGLLGSTIEITSFASDNNLEECGAKNKISDSEGYIHFDSKGNILESNIGTAGQLNERVAINHETGRWVYYSNYYDWWRKRSGHSNHYSHKNNRHGSKAKVGKSTRHSNSTLKKWTFATAYGKSSDTFSCWYNPSGWY